MLRPLLFILIFFIITESSAQGFTSIWNTTETGSSENNEVSIPTNPLFTYNYTVDWGDGTVENNITGNIAHTYAAPGTYTIEISGDFPAIYFNNSGDRNKIIEILSWGTIEWQSMETAFYGCENLNFDAIDAPDLTNVSSLQEMFKRCSSFNGILNNWDVSNITSISGIFDGAVVFNRPLDNWVTSAITDMSFAFDDAALFNEPLDNWNTAAVENMENMFKGATQFNQDINNWVVAQVTNMAGTFESARSFDRPLNNWNVSKVTNMARMFRSTGFNQNIASWNVAAVTDMSQMFSSSQFNQPIGDWDVGAVTNMSSMFNFNRSFNQPLNNWDVSSVINMSSMFRGSGAFPTVFNQPLDLWDVGNVENMSSMFEVAEFNQPINDWDVSSVTNMSNMFAGFSTIRYNFNQPLDQWDVSQVTSMSGMFQSSPFNQPIGNWDVSNVQSMSNMFTQAIDFNQPLNSWITTSLNRTSRMFANASAFNQPLNNWNTGMVIDMQNMFDNASAFSQSLENWDISSVTNMANMLNNTAISLENYDAMLIAWAAQAVNDNVDLGANGLTYCEGREERQELIDTHGWTIIGDTVDCSFVLCTSFLSPQNGETNVPANFDLRWNPAPNATGYNLSVSFVRGGVTTVLLDNSDEGNVVGIDFATDFQPGDIVTALVVPYNGDGPAMGCEEITFTVVANWRDSPNAFKLTIDTREINSSGYSNSNQLRITARRGLTYNYSIDWGDNQFDNNVSNTITHTYLVPGIYTIAIIGDYPAHYYPNSSSDNDKLLSIDQWGTIAWETLANGFINCRGFIEYNATDTPDLSRVVDLSSLFESSNFNGNINNWDVSNVEDMSRTFIGMSAFNQPLNDWDVSNVTDMSDMFLSTSLFNQPLNNWDVSKVITMRRMFDGFGTSMAFNQNLNDWDVSSVVDMTSMFSRCVDFNQPLNNWVLSSVTTMAEMFDGTTSFNQDISNWDVSAVQIMRAMFRSATSFNQPLDNWTVTAVEDMSAMFLNATDFNQPLNQWDVSNVRNMSFMFDQASSFNQPLNNWDVDSATNMEAMFRNTPLFNQNIDLWNVTNVINMASMFEGTFAFNSPLNSWDVNSVVNMSSMFKDAIVFDQPLDSWNVSAVANMSQMFQNAQVFNQNISVWNVSSVTIMNSMFEDAATFVSPMENWQVGSVTRMDNMFKNAIVFNSPLNNWDTGEVLTMQEMFSGAMAFNQDIDTWNTSFVTTMEEMFKDATSYNQAMDSWNVASVNTMQGMFQGASAFNGAIGNWNVRAVTTMQDMFQNASTFNQDIATWRVSEVVNMDNMFQNAVSYNQNMDGWILGSASMRNFLRDATSFNQSLEEWDVSNITNMQNMLDNTAIERINYDNTLIAWSELTLTPGIIFGALTLPYCDALEERQSIIDLYGWNIVGDIRDCPIPECTVLTSPLNGDTDVPVNTNITWEPTLYARGYRLTVGTTPGGNDVVDNETINNDTFYEFATDFNTGDTVYVTLIPFNEEGDAIGPCTEENFTISNDPATIPACTNLTEPVNNAPDVAVTTDLSWTPISNADGYRLTVGTSSGGNELVDDENVDNTTSFEFLTDLPEDSDIFVTIVPYNDEGAPMDCTEEQFHTELIPVAPVCTILTSPENNDSNIAVDTDLVWAAVPNATGYLISVGTTSGGIEIANSIDVNNTTIYDIPDDLSENRPYYVTIIPYNEVGDAIGCGEEIFRTVNSSSPPACTSLLNPADTAIGVAVDITEVTWNGVINADDYRITINGSISDLNDVTDLIVTGTSHPFTNPFVNGETVTVTVIPRIGAVEAVGCLPQSFTIEMAAPTPPRCTSLSSPEDGDTDVALNTTRMEWNPVTNATQYRITISGTANNNMVNVLTSDTFYDFPNAFVNGETATITITPLNGTVEPTSNCSPESFTIIDSPTPPDCTTLSMPMNGATDVAFGTTRMEWNASANATQYRVTITGTANNNVTDFLTPDTFYDFPNAFVNGETATVTITPLNGTTEPSTACTVQEFTIENAPPANPGCTTLSMPMNGATDVALGTTRIEWNASANATQYRVTITGTANNNVTDFLTPDTFYDFPNAFVNGETATVTITPLNGTTEPSTACTTQSFTIIDSATLPECTNISGPFDLDTEIAVDTDISWDVSPNADGYRLRVGTESGMADIFNEDVGNVTTFDLPNDLPENAEIFVFVQPYNAVGDAEFCVEERFMTRTTTANLPNCTSLLDPVDGSDAIPVNTSISWGAVGDVSGYFISIGTSPQESDVLGPLDVGLTTSYQPTEELPSGQVLFVTLTPYNAQGQAQNCDSQSFSTIGQEDEDELESLFGFSPDGDGINDFWTINGIENYPDNTVTIYNRWGDIVFKTGGYDNANNVFRGEANQLTGLGAGQLPEGTYFFILNLPENHNLRTTRGYVVLKR